MSSLDTQSQGFLGRIDLPGDRPGRHLHRQGVADGHRVEDGAGLLSRRSSAGSLAFIGVISADPLVPQQGRADPRLRLEAAAVDHRRHGRVRPSRPRRRAWSIALPVFVIMTAYASVKFRWVPTLALAAVATVFCSLVFVKGLGVPLPLIGRWFAAGSAADGSRTSPERHSIVELLTNLGLGLQTAFTLTNLLYCLVGVFLGTLIGVLPGLGPTATIAMLLPITFGLPPVSALIMLAGIYYGSQYGGSTTAILVNLPGEAASVVTALDGYQMARQGQAGKALATAAIGSFFAGTVATILIALFAPPLARGGAQVRPARLLLADGAGPGRLGRAGARLAAARVRHGRARPAARHGRHRREFRHRALHVRPAATRRRHRLRHRRHGHVRPRRDRPQSRERDARAR